MRQTLATLSFLGLGLAALPAQQVPTGFLVETVVGSGPSANDFCFLADGRMLIANRDGRVDVFAAGTRTTVGTVPQVEIGSERALLGVEKDPAFGTNGHIYVWYSSTADSFMHLDRFTCTGDLNNPSSTNLSFQASSRRVILGNVPDNAFNHNGGTCRFGPDGMLYQSIGDDASSCAAQTLGNQQGVLLRMDVSALPAGGSTTAPTFAQLDPGDNPLSSNTDFSQLVIAYGLRNPVRLTIDPTTHNIYIGDVGQNNREEYTEYVYQQGNLQLVNFGWPWREGTANYNGCGGSPPGGLVDPIADVPQTQGWRSVMGGPRYRNVGGQFDFGSSYDGRAFYGDYYSGEIRMLERTNNTWGPAPAVPGQPSPQSWSTGWPGLVRFDVGPDGAMYVLYHNNSYSSGNGTLLKRVRPLGPINEIVVVSGDGQFGPAGELFPQPLVLQVNDPQQNPLPGAQVNLSITGGTLSTTNPLIADGNGRVQTFVTSSQNGGAATITATTPNGDPGGTTASMFGRRIAVFSTPSLSVLAVTNASPVTPAQVPMIVLASSPFIAPLPTPIGPICTNPSSPLTFVLEDGVGLFGFVTLSGQGGVGTPSLSRIYSYPAGALTGVPLSFQAVGLDPVLGPFRTNCFSAVLQ